MLVRVFAILILPALFLCGCANNKSTAQNDSKSIIRQPESDHDIHGEVGVMYGASASRH